MDASESKLDGMIGGQKQGICLDRQLAHKKPPDICRAAFCVP